MSSCWRRLYGFAGCLLAKEQYMGMEDVFLLDKLSWFAGFFLLERNIWIWKMSYCLNMAIEDISSYLVLSCLILSHIVITYFILFYLVSSNLILISFLSDLDPIPSCGKALNFSRCGLACRRHCFNSKVVYSETMLFFHWNYLLKNVFRPKNTACKLFDHSNKNLHENGVGYVSCCKMILPYECYDRVGVDMIFTLKSLCWACRRRFII